MNLPPEDVVYFVEDDYLHLPVARRLIPQAIPYSDYVAVYDQPDKYGPAYDGGEASKVFRTKDGHWRFTGNTTMTFAAQVKTLRADYDDWMEGTQDDRPNPAAVFANLGGKQRTVAVSVPGAACHTDLTWLDLRQAIHHRRLVRCGHGQEMILNDMKTNQDAYMGAASLLREMAEKGMNSLQQMACVAQFEKETKKAR